MHKILLWGDEGCGKSTIAALLARYAVAGGWSVLVVDAGGDAAMHRLLGVPRPQMTLVEDMGGAEYVRRLYPSADYSNLVPDLPVENLPRTCLSRRDNLALLSLGVEFLEEVGAGSLGFLFREFMGRLDDTGWWVFVDAGSWLPDAGMPPLTVIDGVLDVEMPDEGGRVGRSTPTHRIFAKQGLPLFPVVNRVTSGEIMEQIGQRISPLAVFPEEQHPLSLSQGNKGLPFPPDFRDPLRGLWENLMSCFGSPRASRIGLGRPRAL